MKPMKSLTFKNFLFITMGALIVSIVSGCNSNVDSRSTAAKEAIREVLQEQKAAWNRGDIPAYMRGYKEDEALAFVGSGGVVRGYTTVLERYQKNYPDKAAMGKLDFTELEFLPAGEGYYLVTGKFSLSRKSDQPSGYFTLLWEKTPKGWKIVNDHTS